MAAADVDGDPATLSFFSVVKKSIGGELTIEKTGFAEDVAGGSAAVVAPVIEVGMAAAVFVRLVGEAVGCRDRASDLDGCQKGGAGLSVLFEVHGAHELLFVFDAAFGPFLGTTTADEGEAG